MNFILGCINQSPSPPCLRPPLRCWMELGTATVVFLAISSSWAFVDPYRRLPGFLTLALSDGEKRSCWPPSMKTRRSTMPQRYNSDAKHGPVWKQKS